MRYEIFESHAHHIFDLPLERAVEIFKGEMKRADVERIAFLSIPHEGKEGGKGLTFDRLQNAKTLYLKHAFSPNAYAFAHLEYPRDLTDKERLANDFLKQVEEFSAAGFDGMKMLEGYPSFRKATGLSLFDRAYDKFYSFLEENGIPIVMHLANPESYWDVASVPKEAIAQGRFCDGSYPTKAELHGELSAVMKKHPNLRITLAHFGFMAYDIRKAESWLKEYEHTALDLTPGDEQFLEMLKNWEEWEVFFTRYQDRIIYGTDFYPFYNRRPQFLRTFLETEGEFEFLGKRFRGVNLDTQILKKIYGENMEKRVGAPKPIDLEYIKRKALALQDGSVKNSVPVEEDIRFILRKLK